MPTCLEEMEEKNYRADEKKKQRNVYSVDTVILNVISGVSNAKSM